MVPLATMGEHKQLLARRLVCRGPRGLRYIQRPVMDRITGTRLRLPKCGIRPRRGFSGFYYVGGLLALPHDTVLALALELERPGSWRNASACQF
jgi:hypothetical protein